MNRTKVTHVGFGDESNWNQGRYRSIGLVSCALSSLEELEAALRNLLEESAVSEFKWKELAGAKERFAAEKLCKFTIDQAHKIRADVLIWDIEDSRHSVPQRDDIANLQRMYYHLFRNVLRKRWPQDAVWRLYPDEHTAMDWKTVQDFLEIKSTVVKLEQSLFPGGKFRFRLQQEFNIQEIMQVASHDHPLTQVADLFAGLAVFSRAKFEEYQTWLQKNSPQQTFFDEEENSQDPSRSSKERFLVLETFDRLCKQHRLGVSLKSTNGLRTRDPKNPLNFWLYEPQHPEDRAPQKGKK